MERGGTPGRGKMTIRGATNIGCSSPSATEIVVVDFPRVSFASLFTLGFNVCRRWRHGKKHREVNMKVLSTLVLCLVASMGVFGQIVTKAHTENDQKIKFTGVAYDPTGALVAGAEIKTVDSKGIATIAKSDNNAAFVIELVPGIYAIDVSALGFLTIKFKEYLIVDSTNGQMSMDFVMFGAKYHEPCGYSGADCLPAKSLIRSYEIGYSPKLREIKQEFATNPKPTENIKKKVN